MKKHQGTEDGGVAEAEAVVNLRQVYKAKVVDGGREKKKKKEKEKSVREEEFLSLFTKKANRCRTIYSSELVCHLRPSPLLRGSLSCLSRKADTTKTSSHRLRTRIQLLNAPGKHARARIRILFSLSIPKVFSI